MKVTKEMVHADLRPYFSKHSLIARLHKKPWFRRFFSWVMRKKLHGEQIERLRCEEVSVPSRDSDWKIRTRIYRPDDTKGERLPAMLYFHPGGYLFGCPEMASDWIEKVVQRRPCVVIAPDYRKSPAKPFPAGFNDCYDTLLWAKENAGELGINTEKFIVAGHSAGGGLAAAVTLKARDTQDVDIAFQMPIYPMIDDRQPTDPARKIESPVWDTTLNRIGWSAYLADLHKDCGPIPSFAAPARNKDFRGLPPAVTFVGTIEPFHRETSDYVSALEKAGAEVAFREFEDCYHAFDFLAPFWRRERDSNPRRAFNPYSLSRGALSTTQPSLRIGRRGRPAQGAHLTGERTTGKPRNAPLRQSLFLNRRSN